MNSLKLTIEQQIAIIEFDQHNSKVNILSALSLNEFAKIISELKQKQNELKGLLIISKKPGIFIAGADIKEIESITTPQDAQAKAKAGQDILNQLELLHIPVVALINGVCLGGGLELALACDYRISTFSDKVKLGLPEVKLGIIPGFGGTKRLVQLVGLQKGLRMILSGEPISGKEALKIGLIDKLSSETRLREYGIEFLKTHHTKRKFIRPKILGLLNNFLERTVVGRAIIAHQAKKTVLKNTGGYYPAPLKALEVVVKNYSSALDVSLKREAKIFSELVITEISKNLIRVFYLVEKYKKKEWIKSIPNKINKCAVIGAGVMGGGIAQLITAHNLPVRIKDMSYSLLATALKEAKKIYEYGLKRKKITKNKLTLGMGLISPTTAYSGFANADLVIEAVTEDMKIKKIVFSEVSKIVQQNTILASNTSCLSIQEMAGSTNNTGKVIGMHFFNPVNRMPLIEIIRAKNTDDETVATILDFSRKLGKIPIVVKDSCGFLINRILLPYLTEAGFLLEEGVAIEKVDKIMTRFGMPMGPFTLMDEIGIDVGYKVAYILESVFGERMKVPSILTKMYLGKLFGKKVGYGFYIHRNKKREKIPNKKVYDLLPTGKQTILSDENILDRMLFRMINEAGMCLEESVCEEPSDIDIGMIMGIGFPPFRAGLLNYADTIGIDKIVKDLEKFTDELKSERFRPCNYLLDMAKNNSKFFEGGNHYGTS